MGLDEAPGAAQGFVDRLNQRVIDLRLRYPQIEGVDVDCLFVAFLLETAQFGLFRFGPVTIDVELVEDVYAGSLQQPRADSQHRFAPSSHAFFQRLGAEITRTGTRRPNELHYLLAFMRTPEGLPARIFGELGVKPERVEEFAANERRRGSPAWREPDVFLTPEEVARRLGVNEQTVRAWIRSGKLPASRLAGRKILRIRESDISAVLEPVDPSEFTRGKGDAKVRTAPVDAPDTFAG
jgi:excisionase family DNA binding protein